MEPISLTALRQNIFQVADHVLETGEPAIIERHGRRLMLVPEPAEQERPIAKLDRLPRRKLFNGDTDELVELKVWDESKWHEPDNLA